MPASQAYYLHLRIRLFLFVSFFSFLFWTNSISGIMYREGLKRLPYIHQTTLFFFSFTHTACLFSASSFCASAFVLGYNNFFFCSFFFSSSFDYIHTHLLAFTIVQSTYTHIHALAHAQVPGALHDNQLPIPLIYWLATHSLCSWKTGSHHPGAW